MASVSRLGSLKSQYLDTREQNLPPEIQEEIFASKLAEPLGSLYLEYRHGTSVAAKFTRQITDLLDNPGEIMDFEQEFPELKLGDRIDITHLYIHSPRCVRVPLLEDRANGALRHENNAEHSLENIWHGIQARDYIIHHLPERATEFDTIGDKSFRFVGLFEVNHDKTELITGDVQTCTTTEAERKAKEFIESSVSPILKWVYPADTAEFVIDYEVPDGIFRLGFARMIDKDGPGALNMITGQACLSIYGIDSPLAVARNELKMLRGKMAQFADRQPELLGCYAAHMVNLIAKLNADYTANPDAFTLQPNSSGNLRIPDHENCPRCETNDQQGSTSDTIDLEKTAQDGTEKEKKYLVDPDAVKDLTLVLNDLVKIEQVYLSDEVNSRVRKITDSSYRVKYFATVKGEPEIDDRGKVVRRETECEISQEVFDCFAALNLPRVSKTRYRNKLLPGVTLDVFDPEYNHAPILESEDVENVGPTTLVLIRRIQSFLTEQKIVTLNTEKKATDNQTIALSHFGEQVARYVGWHLALENIKQNL